MLHNNIRLYRRRLLLTQTDLAKLTGLTKNSISSMETGEFGCSVKNALKLSRVLCCTVEDLFYLDPPFELTSLDVDI